MAVAGVIGASTALLGETIGLPITPGGAVAWTAIVTAAGILPDIDHPPALASKLALHGILGGSLGAFAALVSGHAETAGRWALVAAVVAVVCATPGPYRRIRGYQRRKRRSELVALLCGLWCTYQDVETRLRYALWQRLVLPLVVRHRGRTHTVEFAAAAGVLADVVVLVLHLLAGTPASWLWWVGPGVTMGCLAHLVGDWPTYSRVPFTLANVRRQHGHCLRWFRVNPVTDAAVVALFGPAAWFLAVVSTNT